ncbi:MAG: flagellar basal body-associated FliL family protein [Desulfobacteraceae bacterium]|nr:flagellar basal body-associated FliL family protein [Desulfobacteraceae bacterium]
MKRILIILSCFICLISCSKEPEVSEMILGGWINKSGDSYIHLRIKLEEQWEASVKITDVTSKIIQVKGQASGKWHIEDNTLVLTVFESNVNKIYKKNATSFYEIIKLDNKIMQLMDSHGQMIIWNALQSKKDQGVGNINSIRMAPFTVNLNKTRSRDKDRYLCLNLKIVLKELMPDADLHRIHPKAREAALLYLSSLVYKDIKSLDEVKKIQGKLKIVLNPYIGNMIDEVEIDHVIVSSTIDRVEEFLIEHSLKARISKKRDGEGDKKDKGKE